jgi:hypothetical protein
MPGPTRTFHLGDILSITTHRLVSPRGMTGVEDILTWMTGERRLVTSQLPRAGDECRGPLLAQHPDLAGVEVPDFGDIPDEAGQRVELWLTEQAAIYGESREVAPLHADDHTHIDPLTELLMAKPAAVVTAPLLMTAEEG